MIPTLEEKRQAQREAQARFRLRHPDRIREQNRKNQVNRNDYYWRNRERIRTSRRDYERRYYEANRKEIRRRQKEWYDLNKDSERLRVSTHRRLVKYHVLSYYSTQSFPQCANCGVEDLDILCIDHIYNTGNAERKRTNQGKAFYNWLIKMNLPEGYQVLCANCNLKKRMLRGNLCQSIHEELRDQCDTITVKDSP